jgi:prepilin-type N-terminal cleavage/methylation domain-containing protein
MVLTSGKRAGRAAFTLVELLVVIGLMAVLATISVTGYSAASRGMSDRGAIQTVLATLRVAQQTCQIDRVPTKVLFFNQRLTEDTSEDDATLYQGTMIAIKQAGRITLPPGEVNNLLIDEFADWHQSYPMMKSLDDDSDAPGMRIFRMKGTTDESTDIEACSVMVQPCVFPAKLDDWMIQSGTRINRWCESHKRTATDNRPQGAPASYVDNGNNYVWGFKERTGAGGGLGAASWEVGDPYGVEIARLDLPKGYIFGTNPPRDEKLNSATPKEVFFDPDELSPSMSPGSVQISLMRPSQGGMLKPHPVGTISSSMLKDTNN